MIMAFGRAQAQCLICRTHKCFMLLQDRSTFFFEHSNFFKFYFWEFFDTFRNTSCFNFPRLLRLFPSWIFSEFFLFWTFRELVEVFRNYSGFYRDYMEYPAFYFSETLGLFWISSRLFRLYRVWFLGILWKFLVFFRNISRLLRLLRNFPVFW